MRRAVRDEQKEERRRQILEVAWQLFQENVYDDVTMIDVARGAGLAKGTVYLYFKTKEDLFLAVQEQQFVHWFDGVDARLAALDPPATIEDVADIITDSLVERPGLTRLFAILHVVLERNIDYETAVSFKKMLHQRIIHTGQRLESLLPFLASGQGPHLLLQAYALAIGVQHLADPAPVVAEALANEPDLAVFQVDFATTFRQTFVALCHGLQDTQLR